MKLEQICSEVINKYTAYEKEEEEGGYPDAAYQGYIYSAAKNATKLARCVLVMRGLLGAFSEINREYKPEIERCLKECERLAGENV